MKTIPDGAISLVVTSPPYNIGKVYERRQGIAAYLAEQEIVIGELVRLLAEQGSICWQTGNYVDEGEVFPLDIYYYPIFKKYGLKLRNRIIWHFEHGLHASKRFSGRYETLLELVERCVLALTNAGDRVLDPYCGVGSTLLGALMHDRRAVGVEREKEYVSLSKERMYQLYNGTLKTRPLGQPVHTPLGREKVAQVPLEWKLRNMGLRA